MHNPLWGRRKSPKRSQKITGGRGGGFTKRSQEITIKRGVGFVKKNWQTEGAHKGNNYSKDQLSMGGSRGDIFIDLGQAS